MSSGKHFVIQKGKAICNKGTAFPCFNVSSHNKHYWNDEGNSDAYLAVTEDDTKFTPSSAPFGSCALKRGKPCKFSPIGKWTKTYNKVTVMGKKCVIEGSELMCATGGKIKVLQHGQSTSIGKSNIENANDDVQQELNPMIDTNELLEDNEPYAY